MPNSPEDSTWKFDSGQKAKYPHNMTAARNVPDSHSLPDAAADGVKRVDTKLYACTTCVQRKVKCDKRQPCLSCFRSSLPCKYRSTPPSQHRKRKAWAVDERYNQPANQVLLLDKLRAHEAALRSAGIPFSSFLDEWNTNELTAAKEDDSGLEGMEGTPSRETSLPDTVVAQAQVRANVSRNPSRTQGGLLLSEYGGKRYYDHGFMGIMGQEYRQVPAKSTGQSTARSQPTEVTTDMMAAAVLTDMPISLPLHSNHHSQLQPPAATRMKYLSIFLDNVHPLTKIVHEPSVKQLVKDSLLDSQSASKTDTKNALLLSIYSCAVSSLTDSECQSILEVSQQGLLGAFQDATRRALVEASFLKTPDLDLLRAHILLLTSMFHNSDHYASWILMGSAIRMAQSQGLHRDGTQFGLSPFEIEMRRRLWWYIVSLDARLTEIIGGESSLPSSIDARLPSNLDDSDLTPDMPSLPKPRTGATEITFCLARYEIAAFLQERANFKPQLQSSAYPIPSNKLEGEEKSGFSAIESLLEEKYLRFCDPVVPIQLLATAMTRSTLCKLKQMAIHQLGRQTPEDGTPQQQPHSHEQINQHAQNLEEKRQRSFSLALRNLQYENLIHGNKSLRGYLWFVDFHIPWGGPIYILKSLAYRPDWDDTMQSAWNQIEELYEHHPEYIESQKILHLIINGLTLKAWSAREVVTHPPPPFILALQAKNNHRPKQGGDVGGMVTDHGEMVYSDMGGLGGIIPGEFDLLDSFFAAGEWPNLSSQ